MSQGPDSPKSPVFHHDTDDRDVLESLKGLSIKGFHDCHENPNANTPSSTNASLPTPPALKSSRVFLALPEQTFSGHNWYSEDRAIPPNAPLLKDLDSFTDGTGQGSFDFPLGPGADETPLPLIFHPTDDYDDADDGVTTPSTAAMPNSLALEKLPSLGNPTEAVLAWIEGVSATTTTPVATSEVDLQPKKRRRSITQDSDIEARRLRAWSPTMETATPRQETHEDEAYPFDRPVRESPG
ncbi:hypothetical protein BDN70DRAFT_136683 [Pholiota conissans]|uniref:Uncharacterized protein n=1 Tax=Pholiota conissans TaxID=109636 RepID=A0A9P5YYP8_9AGAR|nr:hypothetical protein BDN70DRAFT_136683 [Pholiota conissans]